MYIEAYKKQRCQGSNMGPKAHVDTDKILHITLKTGKLHRLEAEGRIGEWNCMHIRRERQALLSADLLGQYTAQLTAISTMR